MIGLRELAILAVVVLVLYGRSGLLKSRQAQTILPWLSPLRRTRPSAASRDGAASRGARSSTASALSRPPGRAKYFLLRGNRLFWFLTILTATAVAAWIITSLMIASGSGPGVAR
jgi:hypothetical protein